MLIRSAPSACVISANTPGPVGDVDADALERAGVGVGALEHAGGGCRPPRRSSRRGSPRRGASSAASTCSIRRRMLRARRGRPRRCRGRCRPRSAGSRRRCASCRAASRRRSRAGRGPRRALAPAWLTITFASTCGTWLVSATSRSCASGSIATGNGAELGDEAVHEPVALRVGLGRRRQEPGRALEEPGRGVLGAVRLGAADRVAADEARRARGRGDDARLRRADVGDRRRLARGARAPRRPAPAARRSARRRRRARRRRAPPRAIPRARPPRARPATASASGSGSQPATRAPRAPARRGRARRRSARCRRS